MLTRRTFFNLSNFMPFFTICHCRQRIYLQKMYYQVKIQKNTEHHTDNLSAFQQHSLFLLSLCTIISHLMKILMFYYRNLIKNAFHVIF
ncbi:MAG: hypothetical protein H6Q20_2266 [Bacteroidetes bacterium]|nr:hypothetical protein [Bacteroidota bacterium]